MPVIDSHCHIYPAKVAARAVAAIGEFYHEYTESMERDGQAESLKMIGREAGIDHCVVCSAATRPEQVPVINDFIMRTVQESGGYFTGLGTMHPDFPDVGAETDRLISLGLKGIKLHPDIQAFAVDSPGCLEICECCQSREIPILFHTGDVRYFYSNPEQMIRVLENFPHLQVIGAHFGGWSCWESASEKLYRYDNLMVDSSSSLYWIGTETGRRLIGLYSADRVLFGSDFPMWDPAGERERFEKMALGDEEKEKILYRNAMRIFRISDF